LFSGTLTPTKAGTWTLYAGNGVQSIPYSVSINVNPGAPVSANITNNVGQIITAETSVQITISNLVDSYNNIIANSPLTILATQTEAGTTTSYSLLQSSAVTDNTGSAIINEGQFYTPGFYKIYSGSFQLANFEVDNSSLIATDSGDQYNFDLRITNSAYTNLWTYHGYSSSVPNAISVHYLYGDWCVQDNNGNLFQFQSNYGSGNPTTTTMLTGSSYGVMKNNPFAYADGNEWIFWLTQSNMVEAYKWDHDFQSWQFNSPGPTYDTWTNVRKLYSYEYQLYGLTNDGAVYYTGNDGNINPSGSTYIIPSSSNIISLATVGNGVIGLTNDGHLVQATDGSEQYTLPNWTGIIAVAGTYGDLFGLRADGTVAYAGNGLDGTNAVTGWTNVVGIYASYGYVIGLQKNGNLLIAGNANGYGASVPVGSLWP
jgi:hypothetical protein